MIDWTLDRFEDMHEIMCEMPGFMGEWFSDKPWAAYPITIIVIGGIIWWYWFR